MGNLFPRISSLMQNRFLKNAVSNARYFMSYRFSSRRTIFQDFLAISVSLSIIAMVQQTLHGLDSVPTFLAKNSNKASNYFFLYLLLRCFSISASSLLQIGRLLEWCYFSLFARLTLRNKWEKQTIFSDAIGYPFPSLHSFGLHR